MDAPLFVAVNGDIWVQVAHVASVVNVPHGCRVTLSYGQAFFADGVRAEDFLKRMSEGLR